MENHELPQNNRGNNQGNEQRNEPDTQKLVQQHLQDEHHEITDEEIRNVRISTDHVTANMDNISGSSDPASRDERPESDLDNRFVTPWDVTT